MPAFSTTRRTASEGTPAEYASSTRLFRSTRCRDGNYIAPQHAQLQCQYQHSHPRELKARGRRFVAARVGGSVAAVEPSLKIGFGIGLTGPLSGNGKAALVAVQIWAEEVNARGGLIDRKVELIYYDDQGNPAN